jgi:hypothetical protein
VSERRGWTRRASRVYRLGQGNWDNTRALARVLSVKNGKAGQTQADTVATD